MNQDAEAARIRAVVHQWAERVRRGEKMLPYGFDAQGRDIAKGESSDDKD